MTSVFLEYFSCNLKNKSINFHWTSINSLFKLYNFYNWFHINPLVYNLFYNYTSFSKVSALAKQTINPKQTKNIFNFLLLGEKLCQKLRKKLKITIIYWQNFASHFNQFMPRQKTLFDLICNLFGLFSLRGKHAVENTFKEINELFNLIAFQAIS